VGVGVEVEEEGVGVEVAEEEDWEVECGKRRGAQGSSTNDFL